MCLEIIQKKAGILSGPLFVRDFPVDLLCPSS